MANEAVRSPSNDDKIQALMGDYFWRCRLMYKTYISRMRYYEPRYASEKYRVKRDEARAYFEMFLAMLYVTYEGFKDIGLTDEHVDKLASEHIDDLRIARNGVLHFQPTNAKQRRFLADDPRRIRWAEELYQRFHEYFHVQVIRWHIEDGLDVSMPDGSELSPREIHDSLPSRERRG